MINLKLITPSHRDYSDRYRSHLERINEEFNGKMVSRIGLPEDNGNRALPGKGKMLRPLFFVLSCLLCDYEGKDLYRFSTIFEYLHAASLRHDDVSNNADEGRGGLSANNNQDNNAAVLEGDFLASKSFSIALNSNNLKFIQKLTKTAARIAEGQMLKLVKRDDWDINKEAYMEIITARTAALISASCSCGAILSGAGKTAEKSLEEFGLNAGIAFQLMDDLLDYTSLRDGTGKPAGNDLREGRITLPLIYTLSKLKGQERKRIAGIFTGKRATDQDYENLITFVGLNGVVNRVQGEAQFYLKKAITCLNPFPDSSMKRDLIELAEYAVKRKD